MKEEENQKDLLLKTDLEMNNTSHENQIEENIARNMTKEKLIHLKPGKIACIKIGILFGISFLLFVILLPIALSTKTPIPVLYVFIGLSSFGILVSFILVSCCNGFLIISPNEAVVLQYFGEYLGTVKDTGFFYCNPLTKRTKISLRSNQFNGNKIKVNERDGNPVELGIIVVWRIGDTAKAIFDVVNYQSFINTQSEAAIRYIGCKYPYEPVVPGEISLRSGHESINKQLRQELEKRVRLSGIIIEDARITEIAYGDEVAKMMLQKQASNATVFAKDAIVKGATNAIISSLNEFEKNGCDFSKEEKNKFVTNMMTTLCMSSDVCKIVGN